MYKPREVKWDTLLDTRNDYTDVEGAYLPHSCNEWVIGGKAQIEALIKDLQALLLEPPPSAKG